MVGMEPTYSAGIMKSSNIIKPVLATKCIAIAENGFLYSIQESLDFIGT